MGQTAVIYGLDIETDTSGDGWDPAVASVRTVALSCRSLDEVFTGDEATLLAELDHRLATLPPGSSPPGTGPPSTSPSSPTAPASSGSTSASGSASIAG